MLGLIAEVISLRSFSNIWYWLALAAFWTWAMGQVMGVSNALLRQSLRGESADLERLAQIQAQVWLTRWQRGQVWIVTFGTAALGLISVLAFFSGSEFAQAVWFIAMPYALIWLIWLRLALLIMREKPQAGALVRVMFNTKNHVQIIGFAFIFITMFNAFVHLLVNGYFR
jgi:hypothetical protein